MGAVGCPVAVGRGSVLILDAHLLRATVSAAPQVHQCLRPKTSTVSQLLRLMPLLRGWLEDTAKEQTEVKVVTAQVREPRSCGKDCSKLPSSSFLPSLARPVPSLPLLSPSSVMRNGALLRVELRK